MKVSSVLLPFFLLLAIGMQERSCNKHQTPPTNVNVSKNMKRLEESIWGGEHIYFSVTKSGAMVEFDCSHGTIDQIIELDSEGKFEAKGIYEDEKGGPSQVVTPTNDDEPAPANKTQANGNTARYSGNITANKMTLTITLTNTGKVIGTFHLIKDKAIRLKKCL